MWHWAPCLTSFSLAQAHTLISHPVCLFQGPCCLEDRVEGASFPEPCPAQLLSGSEHHMCLYLTPPATSTTSRVPSPPLVIFMLSIYFFFFRGFACWILDYQCGGPSLERHCPGSNEPSQQWIHRTLRWHGWWPERELGQQTDSGLRSWLCQVPLIRVLSLLSFCNKMGMVLLIDKN